jgi:hypothetical protein
LEINSILCTSSRLVRGESFLLQNQPSLPAARPRLGCSKHDFHKLKFILALSNWTYLNAKLAYSNLYCLEQPGPVVLACRRPLPVVLPVSILGLSIPLDINPLLPVAYQIMGFTACCLRMYTTRAVVLSTLP